MNQLHSIFRAAALLALLFAPISKAMDFLYVEDTVEYAKLVSVQFDTAARRGTLVLEHDCAACPTQINYNSSMLLETPFGKNRPLQEIVEWQGNPVMVHYSLPTPVATQVVIYPLNAEVDDFETVDQAEE